MGQLSETVEVTDTTPLLQSTSSAVGEVIENRMITDLPLNNRQPLQLALMVPGVNPGRQMTSSSQPFNRSNNFSVGGGRGNVNEIMLDGTSNTMPEGNPAFSAVTVFPSVDSIQEFRVQTNAYSAEYGNSGGGLVNIVSKSGTNRLHGSAFEFLRNSRMDANNFFNNRSGIPLASFKRNQFGGAVGGPLFIPRLYDGRNRTFFFTTWESTIERNGVTYSLTVPTAPQRAGDFSQTFTSAGARVNIADPLTTVYDAATRTYTRTLFANGVIPQSRIDPVMARVMKEFPSPTESGAAFTGAQNFVRSISQKVDDKKFDIRLDQNAGDRHKFYGRYSWNTRLSDRPSVLGTIGDQYFGRLPTDPQGVKFGYTYVVSPQYLLDAKFGLNHLYFGQVSGTSGYDITQLGFPKAYADAIQAPQFPRFTFTDYTSLGYANATMESWQSSHHYQASVSRSSGSRVTKFGYEARRGRVKRFTLSTGVGAGNFAFSKGYTQGPNAQTVSAASGNAIASALLGAASSGSVAVTTTRSTVNWSHAAYLQDDWRVSARLTVNAGIRYDLQLPMSELENNMNWFDPSAPSPIAGQVAGVGPLSGAVVFATPGQRNFWRANRDNFAPRVGLAYRVSGLTVLRAGYGIFFAPHPYGSSANTGPGFTGTTTYIGSVDGFRPTGSLANPYPGGFVMPIGMGTAPSPLVNLGQAVSFLPSNVPTPYVQQWNFTLQQQVSATFSVEGGYVGSKGTHLPDATHTLNQLRPENLGPQILETVPNPFFGTITTGTLSTAQVQRRYLMTAFPQYTSVNIWSAPAASSIYHSFQFKANKRFSRSLNFLLAYTFSKQIDDCSGLYDWLEPASAHQNYYDRRADRAVSDQDMTHRLALTFNYDLPFGRNRAVGKNWRLADLFFGGWQTNGLLTLQSGIPLPITTTNNSYAFNTVQRPNSTGQSAALEGDPQSRLNRYLRTDAFTQTPLYTFGNAPRNLPDVRGPGLAALDFALFKNVTLREGLRLQVRGEAFNLTNTPEFNNPDTSLMSSSFGRITSQRNTPRQVQLGLKLLF